MPTPTPRPTQTARTVRPSPAKPSAPRPKWNWLEWFPIAQTLLPALLFLPGIAAVRTPIRVASYGVGLIAWIMIFQSGRSRPGAESFRSLPWLKLVSAWLGLLIFHPETNSPIAGIAHVVLYISIFSPAFWAHSTVIDTRQITRMMAILFLCNSLSALVGLGQVFRPGTFNPPVIPGLTDETSLSFQALTYLDAAGNRIARPCGLTDQIGAAAPAGATAALIGLAFALRPIGIFRRLCCLVCAFFGFAVIYYTQVRMILLMLVICLAALITLFFLQRNFRQATLLGGFGFGMVLCSFAWVASTSGDVVTERFLTLLSNDPVKTYQGARGMYVQEAFDKFLWEYPAGAGLGWWGQIYQYFGDKSRPTRIWVEVMWPAWIIDGGILLLVLYNGAVIAAVFNTLKIALTSKDRELGFWAAVIFSSNLSQLATTFSYVTFLSSIGMQFWFLSAAIHAGDVRAKSKAAAARRQAKSSQSRLLAAAQGAPVETTTPRSPSPPPSTPPPSSPSPA